MQDAIDIKVLQTLNSDRKRHCFRSAGVCPPRVFNPNEKRRGERSAGACPPRSLPKRKTPATQRPRTFAVTIDAWRGPVPRPTVNGDGFLLPNHHFPRRFEITRRECVEIHATRNRLIQRIPTIPIRRTALRLVNAGR